MTKKSQNALQREEMTPFEGRATVTISSIANPKKVSSKSERRYN